MIRNITVNLYHLSIEINLHKHYLRQDLAKYCHIFLRVLSIDKWL